MPDDPAPAVVPIGGVMPDPAGPAMTFAVVNGQRVPVDDDPNTIGTLARHVGAQLNPIAGAQALASAVQHPVDTVKAIGAAQGAVFDKAKASYAAGDYGTAARHFIDYLLPLVGPVLDKAADASQAGHVAAGAGDAIGLGLSLFAPSAIGKTLASRTAGTPAAPPPSTPLRDAVAFGRARGIPIDAGTATDNAAVRGVQALADKSLGGSIVAGRAGQAQAAALTRVGGELADTARAGAVTTDQAGEAVQTALTTKLQAHAALADRAYGTLRQLEAANPTAFAMDLAPVRAALKPLYLRLAREAELVPLQGDKARVLTALDRLVKGYPAAVPLSVVDEALGDLKTLARADTPELRTAGQGVAAQAVQQLDQAVRTTAQRAGPQAIRALEQGRAATVAKYQTADVLDTLRTEPVQVYRQMTAPKDSGIDLLRSVTGHAPQAAPQIARAYLDDLLATATAEGGFGHADALYAAWQKLGSQTKAILFPQPGQAQALDQFFLLAKRLAANPNPSGTGQAVMRLSEGGALFTNPIAFVLGEAGAAGLSAILHAPQGVPVMTRALSLALKPQVATAAQRTATTAALLRVAASAKVPLPLPATAQSAPPP